MRAYVLHHSDLGIFLGVDDCGFCDWSRQSDGARGRYTAKAWSTPEGAAGFLDSFYEIADDVRTVPVDIETEGEATVKECVRAGLPRWDPEEER